MLELNAKRKEWTWCGWKLQRKIFASRGNLQQKVKSDVNVYCKVKREHGNCRPRKNGSVDGTDES